MSTRKFMLYIMRYNGKRNNLTMRVFHGSSSRFTLVLKNLSIQSSQNQYSCQLNEISDVNALLIFLKHNYLCFWFAFSCYSLPKNDFSLICKTAHHLWKSKCYEIKEVSLWRWQMKYPFSTSQHTNNISRPTKFSKTFIKPHQHCFDILFWLLWGKLTPHKSAFWYFAH